MAVLYNLGNSFYLMDQFDSAKESYLTAIELDPSSAECHFNLGTIYNILKETSQCISHYEKSIELDPNNQDAYLCLKKIFEQE